MIVRGLDGEAERVAPEVTDPAGTPSFDPNNPFGEDTVQEDQKEGSYFNQGENREYEEPRQEVHGKHASAMEASVPVAIPGPFMQNKRSRMLDKKSGDPLNRLQPVTECSLCWKRAAPLSGRDAAGASRMAAAASPSSRPSMKARDAAPDS